ncbi:exported hypothetical protein [Candidatus Terasakiella magnetica]|uniref:Solute-binding protein family 3/N-terminal domain-containing protein n=1 Tax=Candidatus Terasakiella magnetica TaxID=1867952 RepID=A0A1C3RF29_9PROT|nr:ABC transporter substrate-binding protein [Candidatus Terasakiella magnetica]SCA55887.1 exported hypothetical protein [Candidatus Terasakiella magnetica]
MKLLKSMVISLILIVFALAPNITLADEKPILTFGSGKHMPPPFVFHFEDYLVTGLLKDIATSVAKELNAKSHFSHIPRKRSVDAITKGTVDVLCLTSPKWLGELEGVKWTVPLYDDHEIIIMRKADAVHVSSINSLKGLKIGTISGFNYPHSIDPIIKNGLAKRRDASNLIANLEKLNSGTIDAVVDGRMKLNYLVKAFGYEDKITTVFTSKNSVPIQCVVSKQSEIPYQHITDAFDRIKSNGVVQKILKKYDGTQ